MNITSYYTRLKRRNNWKRYWKKNKYKLILRGILLLVVLLIFFIGLLVTGANKGRQSKHNTTEVKGNVLTENQLTFSGKDYIILNDNKPNFTQKDIENIQGEHYSELDKLGRCGAAYAMLDRSMMPTEERGEIGHIKPSGWHTVKYPEVIEDRYLYNRSHLIAYALTGQNDNELNLITGTRYMNATTMLPFEKEIMKYLDGSTNRVLYRVTPHFVGNEMVARGVEMEAYSVEDNGAGVCFHVFVYNYQPGIEINYLTGESKIVD